MVIIYKVVIWAFYGISLWKEKVALNIYKTSLQLKLKVNPDLEENIH